MATSIGALIWRNAAVLGKGREVAPGFMPRALQAFLASDQGVVLMTGFWRMCGFCWITGGLLQIVGLNDIVPKVPKP